MIDEYTDEEIINNINQVNTWVNAESIYRLETTGRMIKIKMQNPQMATKATNDGITVLYQRIPAKHIEKETFVKIIPCYNCYAYTHKTRECPIGKQTLCAFYGANNHIQQQCKETEPKCINCNGRHRTLAAACPKRKEIIKNKGKEIRERSRSRSRARQAQSYAGATTSNTQQPQTSMLSNTNADEMKNLISKIITSITFAHYLEAFQPGSFQGNIDKMFEINGIPKVNFPTDIVTTGIRELYRDTILTQQQKQQEQQRQQTQIPQQQQYQHQQGEKSGTYTGEEGGAMVMDIDSQKRIREISISPQTQSDAKKKKETEINIETMKQTGPTRQSTDTTQMSQSHSLNQSTQATRSHEQPLALPPKPGRVPREGNRPKSSERREPSLTRTLSSLTTKDIGIKVLFKRSSKYNIESTDIEKREILREAICRGEAKLHWRNQNVTYEAIHAGFIHKKINMNEITYEKCPDNLYEKIKSKCY